MPALYIKRRPSLDFDEIPGASSALNHLAYHTTHTSAAFGGNTRGGEYCNNDYTGGYLPPPRAEAVVLKTAEFPARRIKEHEQLEQKMAMRVSPQDLKSRNILYDDESEDEDHHNSSMRHGRRSSELEHKIRQRASPHDLKSRNILHDSDNDAGKCIRLKMMYMYIYIIMCIYTHTHTHTRTHTHVVLIILLNINAYLCA